MIKFALPILLLLAACTTNEPTQRKETVEDKKTSLLEQRVDLVEQLKQDCIQLDERHDRSVDRRTLHTDATTIQLMVYELPERKDIWGIRMEEIFEHHQTIQLTFLAHETPIYYEKTTYSEAGIEGPIEVSCLQYHLDQGEILDAQSVKHREIIANATLHQTKKSKQAIAITATLPAIIKREINALRQMVAKQNTNNLPEEMIGTWISTTDEDFRLDLSENKAIMLYNDSFSVSDQFLIDFDSDNLHLKNESNELYYVVKKMKDDELILFYVNRGHELPFRRLRFQANHQDGLPEEIDGCSCELYSADKQELFVTSDFREKAYLKLGGQLLTFHLAMETLSQQGDRVKWIFNSGMLTLQLDLTHQNQVDELTTYAGRAELLFNGGRVYEADLVGTCGC